MQLSVTSEGQPAWYGVANRRIPGAFVWFNHPGDHYTLSDSIICPDIIDTNELLLFDEHQYVQAWNEADQTSQQLISSANGSRLITPPEDQVAGVVYEPTPWEDEGENCDLKPYEVEVSRLLQCLWLPNVTTLNDDLIHAFCPTAPGLTAFLRLRFAKGSVSMVAPPSEFQISKLSFPVCEPALFNRNVTCKWETAAGNYHGYVRFLEHPFFPVWLKVPLS